MNMGVNYCNRETLNVALWINNNYDLYCAARRFMRTNPKCKTPYIKFIDVYRLKEARTSDGVLLCGLYIDYDALDEFMRELISD